MLLQVHSFRERSCWRMRFPLRQYDNKWEEEKDMFFPPERLPGIKKVVLLPYILG